LTEGRNSTGGSDSIVRFLLRPMIFIGAVLAVCSLVVLLGMKAVNSKLDLENLPGQDELEAVDLTLADSLWVIDVTATHEIEEIVIEGPETGWPVTPCSIFVSADSQALQDSLPEARTTVGIPYETLLVVRRWAAESGLPEPDLDRIYVFNHLDSLYVDLPVALDFDGLRRTIEGRFICYTRLYPLVGGSLLSNYEDGIRLAGVPGVFSRP
jgi:hypothetical protein